MANKIRKQLQCTWLVERRNKGSESAVMALSIQRALRYVVDSLWTSPAPPEDALPPPPANKTVSESSLVASYRVTPDMVGKHLPSVPFFLLLLSSNTCFVRCKRTDFRGRAAKDHRCEFPLCSNVPELGSLTACPRSLPASLLVTIPRDHVSQSLSSKETVYNIASPPPPLNSSLNFSRVIFITEVFLGDIMHLYVSVNRAWGSSLETGVRCVKQDGKTGQRSYACHAYLTFVARPQPPLASSSAPIQKDRHRVKVPSILPVTLLEKKRYLLAGRRRAHRIRRHAAWDALVCSLRDYVLRESAGESERRAHEESDARVQQLEALEREMLVDAYVRGDEDVKVIDGQWVVAEIEGAMEPIRAPLAEIEREASKRGRGAWKRIVPTGRVEDYDELKEDTDANGNENGENIDKVLDIMDTHIMTIHIVRPQVRPTRLILFG
jgi:acyl-CoA hydrolase